jgi:protein TonB
VSGGGTSGNGRRWLIRLLALALVAALVGWLRATLLDSERSLDRYAQRVRLIEPPPPPPKKIEAPPPEPELADQVAIAPQSQAEDPGAVAQDDRLGVDASASGSGDGFGLAAKKGGQDLVGEGLIASTLSPGRFNYYTGQVENIIQNELFRHDELRAVGYVAIVKLWVDADGRIARVSLARSTGDAALDDRLREALAALQATLGAPPEDMPQPIRIRVTSRIS